jgi:hypothetical protein
MQCLLVGAAYGVSFNSGSISTAPALPAAELNSKLFFGSNYICRFLALENSDVTVDQEWIDAALDLEESSVRGYIATLVSKKVSSSASEGAMEGMSSSLQALAGILKRCIHACIHTYIHAYIQHTYIHTTHNNNSMYL